jgi:hypothetical protein
VITHDLIVRTNRVKFIIDQEKKIAGLQRKCGRALAR